MKQIPTSLLTLTAGILVTLVSLWVGQNHHLLPEQASEQAPLVDGLFDLMMIIGTALFIVVQGAIIIFLIKYRQRPGDEGDGLPIEGNLPLEAFWTAIPAIIVIGLGIYSVEVFQEMGGLSPSGHNMMMGMGHSAAMVAQMPADENQPVAGDTMALMDDSTASAPAAFEAKYGFGATPAELNQAPDVTVNVTGMQYAWIFNYPDSNITTGELIIPVGKDVQLNLSAQDVIHSFWVPQFRLKQDALPGQPTGLRFVATKVGTYPVVCAELCGSYHGGMRSQVVVKSQDEYDAWVSENRQVALTPSATVVATSPASLSDADYLAPYGEELGIDAAHLAHLQAGHS